MPGNPNSPTFPGVYIKEIPSGVRTITGVATSITAFIGRASRGPVNKATTINSFSDFERSFGGLWVESNLGFAVRDFYLNGGNEAIIVRLFHPYFLTAGDRDHATAAAQQVADAANTAAGDKAAVAAAADQKAHEIEGNVNFSHLSQEAARFVANAAKAEADKSDSTVDTVKKAATDAVARSTATKARIVVDTLTLEAASEGSWGNYLRVRVDDDVSQDVATRFNVKKSDLFNLTVRDMNSGITEQFRNVTVVDSPRRIDKVLENESNLVRVVSLPATPPKANDADLEAAAKGNDQNKAKSAKAALNIPPFTSNTETRTTGVADDAIVTDGEDLLDADDFTPPGAEDQKKGLYALKQVDLFNLLYVPPYNNPTGQGYNTEPSLISSAAQFCEDRRAMLLVDSPSGWIDKNTAVSKFTDPNLDHIGTRSQNAALFFPRLRKPNPLHDDQTEDFGPGGAVAGIFARTDAQRGVWKAPAGLDTILTGVPQLSVVLTDEENGDLNPLGINCLRFFQASGRVIWGSRTLKGDDRLASEWKYIPVRRTALFIEESLFRGTQWVVFEPNDEPLWAQIRLNVGAFMHNLFVKGAFQGKAPREAYFVKCDSETTTQNDIDLGIVNIVVGFAPLKPVEFVIISIQQMAGQIQV
jgi:phage tail sheath protein FI